MVLFMVVVSQAWVRQMKRRITLIQLKDGKQLYCPSDAEMKELWSDVERVDIEESYTIDEWNEKFIVIRGVELCTVK